MSFETVQTHVQKGGNILVILTQGSYVNELEKGRD